MEYGTALVRTVTNFIVAWLLSIPFINTMNIDGAMWTALVTAVVGAVYYALVHWAELNISPKFSLLLASNKQPAGYVAENKNTGGMRTR